MDCSPPGSSVHGIPQARILDWVAIPFSTQGSNPGLLHCRQILYHLKPIIYEETQQILCLPSIRSLSQITYKSEKIVMNCHES